MFGGRRTPRQAASPDGFQGLAGDRGGRVKTKGRPTEQVRSEPATLDRDAIARGRREFLRAAGLGGAALALAACGQDVLSPTVPNAPSLDRKHDDGRGGDDQNAAIVIQFKDDFGVLNYAYALEQLEAAFYITVLSSPYAGMTASEMRLLTDVRDHEIAHRDFFKAVLGDKAIRAVTPDFSAIDFGSRASVLGTARTFEDLGVAAYNGAAKYIENTTYLVIAGKIVSVEARHASAIRDLIAPKTGAFAPKAFDDAFEPPQVLAAADPFIASKIVLANFPGGKH